MVKRLHLEINCCRECPYLVGIWYGFFCKYGDEAPDIKAENINKEVYKDCPLEDKLEDKKD